MCEAATPINFDAEYKPQPKQAQFHQCVANEILYGGAAGPGKSMAIRWEGLMWCARIPGLQVYLFRRTYPELEKNHILPSLTQFPNKKDLLGRPFCVYKKQDKRWEFANGSMLHFCHCQYENDVTMYQGAEIHLLLIDELTTFTEFIYDYLRARVRCTLSVPEQYKHKVPGIACASNPGGVGHSFVKLRWVDYAQPYDCKRAEKKEGGMVRCFIPGKLQDNPKLMKEDPTYIDRLDGLPEPWRSAFKDGNWNIFMGQAFQFTREHHVIKPMTIPADAPIYTTFDWGYGAPFSWGWWWVDHDGRLIRFAEWYGWNKDLKEGLRLTDSEIAEGIIAREEAMNLNPERVVTRFCGPDCFSKKPDYMGGGQGPATAEVFQGFGLILTAGDPDRKQKIRQFRERLLVPGLSQAFDTTSTQPRTLGVPQLLVYEGCADFIRTIPELQMDEKNVEDVDTKGEDHIYDEACHMCMARPLNIIELPQRVATPAEAVKAFITGKTKVDPEFDGTEGQSNGSSYVPAGLF